MIEPSEVVLRQVVLHVRLHRSPSIAVRLGIALLGGLGAVGLTAPVVYYLWGRPEAVDAIAAVLLRQSPDDVPGSAAGVVALLLGMLVGAVLEVTVAAVEQVRPEPVVLFNEVTQVDVVAAVAVMALVFVGGVVAVRHMGMEFPEPSPPTAYRRWFALSVGFVAVVLWLILLVYDLLGLTGLL